MQYVFVWCTSFNNRATFTSQLIDFSTTKIATKCYSYPSPAIVTTQQRKLKPTKKKFMPAPIFSSSPTKNTHKNNKLFSAQMHSHWIVSYCLATGDPNKQGVVSKRPWILTLLKHGSVSSFSWFHMVVHTPFISVSWRFPHGRRVQTKCL